MLFFLGLIAGLKKSWWSKRHAENKMDQSRGLEKDISGSKKKSSLFAFCLDFLTHFAKSLCSGTLFLFAFGFAVSFSLFALVCGLLFLRFFNLQLFFRPATRPRKRAQSLFQRLCIVLSRFFPRLRNI